MSIGEKKKKPVQSKIIEIIAPSVFRLEKEWTWHGVTSNVIRLAGILPPKEDRRYSEIIKKGRRCLVGKLLIIRTLHFIEEGYILVADLEIEGIEIAQFYKGLVSTYKPRLRVEESGDTRHIRKVRGWVASSWKNPLSVLPLSQSPVMEDRFFPTDPWKPDYSDEVLKIKDIFCSKRICLDEDVKHLEAFLETRPNNPFILYGDCGSGKSWFTRNFLVDNKPDDVDVGFIDISDSGDGEESVVDFKKRIHIRLAEILDEYVNSCTGGLREALRPMLKKKVAGVYPNTDYDKYKVKRWCQKFINDISMPSNIIDFNWIRLQSYGYYNDRCLLLVIDNIDAFCHREEQAKVLNSILQIIGTNKNVLTIVPLRPDRQFMTDRLSSSLQHLLPSARLSPLVMHHMIKSRLSISSSGENIFEKPFDAGHSHKKTITLKHILRRYHHSESENLIESIAGNDARHYIRLFRRLLYSAELKSFNNIGNEYHCISALMLKPNESYDADMTYILNVFDNDHPGEVGNVLIRWRVLEYFLYDYGDCSGPFFEYYFSRLGYSLDRVREVVKLWHFAGALDWQMHNQELKAEANRCAYQYQNLIAKLWYCIVIKTGMNIEERYILTGMAAKRAAEKHRLVGPDNEDWEYVDDTGFLHFIEDEELLEMNRLEKFQHKNEAFEDQCKSHGPKRLIDILSGEYLYQERKWEKKASDKSHDTRYGDIV